MLRANGHILMVVTSHSRIDADHATGLWLEEFAVPYNEFRREGLEVTVASPRGGETPIDPNSDPTVGQAEEWAEARERLRETVRVEEIEPRRYVAVFLPGGHGTMFDFPDHAPLEEVLADFAGTGRVIAAVCHGPAALVNLRRPDGSPYVAGRTLTAFTDAEEREVGLDRKMPFLLESRLREERANFVAYPNWQDHTEVDGNLVTGQNPQSSLSSARAVLNLLRAASVNQAA